MFGYKMTLEKTQNRDVVAQKLQCYNSGGVRGEAGPKRTRRKRLQTPYRSSAWSTSGKLRSTGGTGQKTFLVKTRKQIALDAFLSRSENKSRAGNPYPKSATNCMS